MKSDRSGFGRRVIASAVTAVLLSTQFVSAAGPGALVPEKRPTVTVYLVEPGSELAVDLPDGVPDDNDLPPAKTAPSTKPTTAPSTQPAKPPIDLDDLIKKAQLNDRQKRILERTKSDQAEFLNDMDQFVTARFNPADDKGEMGFVQIRDNIVRLTMDAPDLRSYYQRLYLINDTWLRHPTEKARFDSLDKGLRDEWMKREDHRRHIRSIIMTVSMITGTIAGGFISYKASERFIPIAAEDKGFATITKIAARFGVVIVGAGVGAALGQYAGFLGSDLLLKNNRDYFDPIDGTEDLREILDVIDTL